MVDGSSPAILELCNPVYTLAVTEGGGAILGAGEIQIRRRHRIQEATCVGISTVMIMESIRQTANMTTP